MDGYRTRHGYLEVVDSITSSEDGNEEVYIDDFAGASACVE